MTGACTTETRLACPHPADRPAPCFAARDYVTGDRFKVGQCPRCGLVVRSCSSRALERDASSLAQSLQNSTGAWRDPRRDHAKLIAERTWLSVVATLAATALLVTVALNLGRAGSAVVVHVVKQG